MTIIKGQIEPLKRIKAELNAHGISRFNSIGEINAFLKNYDFEISQIQKSVQEDINEEIKILESISQRLEQEYNDKLDSTEMVVNEEIDMLANKISDIKSTKSNFIFESISGLKHQMYLKKKVKLERQFNKIIESRTLAYAQKARAAKLRFLDHMTNKTQIVEDRCRTKFQELSKVKNVVEDLYPLIAGAIGEGKVVNELKKLSDKYILINDFSIEFDPPIYNRNDNDRVFSIQVDHLLVSQSGVFLIETKNWSQNSIESISLRSPIDQIRRSSYALFVLLNSNSYDTASSLMVHHWGEKKIPIRNVVAMINRKPKEKFKHAAVKTIKELNGYIEYFEPIFNEVEVEKIANYLESKLI